MPSCVINCCKNNSCFQNKSSGITFHKFPNEITLKQNWIDAVRNNRNEADWLPSKFSVICSLHFEESDIYQTKGGYRRIKKKAVPKKTRLVNSEWCLETQLTGIEPNSLIPERSTEGFNIEENIEAVDHNGHTLEKLTDDVPIAREEINTECQILGSEIDSISDYTKREKLRQQNRKYEILYKIHARKIKTLNQKLRRLKRRNASLKSILKKLKDKKYIDTNIFNILGDNVVAAELSHIMNVKKIGKKKKIHYSPAMRQFCLTLNFHSPKAYDYVRQTFKTCLPHRKTLAKWHPHIDGEPGVTKELNANITSIIV